MLPNVQGSITEALLGPLLTGTGSQRETDQRARRKDNPTDPGKAAQQAMHAYHHL